MDKFTEIAHKLRIVHDNLIIKPLEYRDLNEYISILKDKSFYEFMDVKVIADIPIQKAKEILTRLCNQYKRSKHLDSELRLIIKDESINKIIGSLVIQKPINNSIEIGWYIHPKYNGRNLGYQTCSRLIGYIFANMTDIDEVVAEIQDKNIKSIRMAHKLGFNEISRYKGAYTTNVVYKLYRRDYNDSIV